MIKPFRSNEQFENTIAKIASYPHLDAGIYGIIGLAGETAADIENTEQWIAHLLHAYGDGLGELAVTPLATEPGSLVHRNAGKYGMKLVRETFEDYLEFTRLKYLGTEGIHEQPYDPFLPHPYGLHDESDTPDRVYQDYQRINSRIEATFSEKRISKMEESLSVHGENAMLVLRNRNHVRAIWDFVIWASSSAMQRGCRRLIVDATEAFITVPETSVLELTGTHDYTLSRLPGLRDKLSSGEFQLIIIGRDDQRWGAYKEVGAIVQNAESVAQAA